SDLVGTVALSGGAFLARLARDRWPPSGEPGYRAAPRRPAPAAGGGWRRPSPGDRHPWRSRSGSVVRRWRVERVVQCSGVRMRVDAAIALCAALLGGALIVAAPLPAAAAAALLGCLVVRSEEHTSELQSRENLVCRLLL